MRRSETTSLVMACTLALVLVLLPLCALSCTGRTTLRVMAADALAHSFHRLVDEYRRLHPDVDVSLETQGSIMLGRLALLRPTDVLAVADSRLIHRILGDDGSDWVVSFATNELVIVYVESSRGGADLTTESWRDIVFRSDVRLGLANPEQDPCGYFTLLAWSLAERYYQDPGLAERLAALCPPERLAWDAAQMLARMQGGEGDMAFAYRSHAHDMNLPYVPLPDAINLGCPDHEDVYRQVSVPVPDFGGGSEPLSGTVVTFGVTIPRDARSVPEAQAFVDLLLGPVGRRHLEHSYFQVINPPRLHVWGDDPPDSIGEITMSAGNGGPP